MCHQIVLHANTDIEGNMLLLDLSFIRYISCSSTLNGRS